ncbi:MAG: hypothetical protein R2705_14330 [Ilumatobacteraceae bacterium]
MIQTARGSNDVAIRSLARRASTVVHPKRLAVHLGELDPTEDCYAVRASAPSPRPRTPRLSPLPVANWIRQDPVGSGSERNHHARQGTQRPAAKKAGKTLKE